MFKTQDSTKAARLEAKLQKVLWSLEEVERELRAMEEGWGGSPFLVNPAEYQHDPMTLVYIAQARGRYAYLQYKREALQEMAYALMRRLQEVAK
jgi:hypothetical protein